MQIFIMNIIMTILILTKLQIYSLQSDFDARNRVRDLNEYNKIHLNEMGRKNMPDDGAFNISQNSYHNVDNDVESNDSEVNSKDGDSSINRTLIISK